MSGGGLWEYDEKAAARILEVTPRTLQTWRKDGKIAFYQLPGGRVRYSAEQLADFQRRCHKPARLDAAE